MMPASFGWRASRHLALSFFIGEIYLWLSQQVQRVCKPLYRPRENQC
jgi:hypothetical protein